MAETFDIIIIGAGPAGYVCAIRAAQLGQNVCLIDKRAALGGTCLNVGCIPSKALLQSSHHYHMAAHGMAKHGIEVSKLNLNLSAMLARKDAVVKQLTSGIGMLMKKNKITVKTAWATLKSAGIVTLDNGEELRTKHIVIATGSVPVELPFAKFDHTKIIDSTDALNLPNVPKHLVVIGAGVIGLEMGSVWRRLGAEVTVIDIANRPVAIMDEDLGRESQKLFEKQGLVFHLESKVQTVETTKQGVKVTIQKADGSTKNIEGDIALVAVGRKSATSGMGLAEAGVALDARGVIQVDAHYQTNLAGIYAIGDCIPGPMLAHKGEEEGVALAEMLAGQAGHVNYGTIPWVVYTHPELAGVGLTEAEATAKFGGAKIGKFKFAANGRALAIDDSDGFAKVIAHPQTDELLGVHLIGGNVSEMIGEAVAIMEFKGSAEDLARTVHAHPTMTEAVKEAALAATGNRAIHA
ncbi:MAG: dihydrolipoyl dehydrogenase [Proteobacteria bacterium]|nr:dihydrolipoyl dehydrogenase [Pseudomonadota bacterium]NBX86473.1 dihydrolipoyl dehydrogenase [Pseudomonadota bacterium]